MGRKFYILYILAKVYFNAVLRIIKNTIIMFFGKTKLGTKISCPVKLKKENFTFQKKFAKIFIKYDECKNCVYHCCHSRINRFDFVDCYLQGFTLKQGISPMHKISHILPSVADIIYRMYRFQEKQLPRENCFYYSSSVGCLLPIGSRPNMCIAGVCYNLLRKFNENDLRNYSSLLNQYIFFHTKCFFYLFEELKKR